MKWGFSKMRFNVCLAALAATFATATPALAQQASAQAEARGVVVQPLTLARVQDLDFGTVVGSAAAGSVVIDADTGGRTVSGGVTAVPSFPGDRGLFQGAGTAGQTVVLQLSAPSLLISQSNPLDTITVTSMTLDQGNLLSRTIPAGGVFQVGVGGDFAIAANQAPALYSANFDLTADYQ
jgi:hypothetical protein